MGSIILLISNKPRIPVSHHPIAAMLQEIQNDSLRADVLLCLGDLCDRADEQGLISAWSFTEEIERKLEAKLRIGLPGNHDINSRNHGGKDAFSFVKDFHELFPTISSNENIKFWELGFCVYQYKQVLFLLLNTVHDHIDEDHATKPKIKPKTLSQIRKELSAIQDEYSIKICIMHHHPIKHSNIANYRDSDSLDKGDDLIDILNEFGFTILIHGHKHQPRIVEYSGLPVFATGSFSSFANLQGTG